MHKIILFLLSAVLLASCQTDPETEIKGLLKNKDLKLGLAVYDFNSGKSIIINGEDDFPLQSVFKYHIAVKVMDDVENNKLDLKQAIAISADELIENTYSPLREDYGKKDLSIRLDTLLYYMVSLSDNNAADILLRKVGGPKAVNDYFKNIEISGTQIEVNEDQMHENWENQYRNIATPQSMLETLKRFYLRQYLNGDSHNFIFGLLTVTKTGKNKLKAGLPEGAILSHKTGNSDRNADGVVAASNDVGFIQLPNTASAIVAVVFITESKESDEVNEKLIADIARIISKLPSLK